jgi:hypothetical protein
MHRFDFQDFYCYEGIVRGREGSVVCPPNKPHRFSYTENIRKTIPITQYTHKEERKRKKIHSEHSIFSKFFAMFLYVYIISSNFHACSVSVCIKKKEEENLHTHTHPLPYSLTQSRFMFALFLYASS